MKKSNKKKSKNDISTVVIIIIIFVIVLLVYLYKKSANDEQKRIMELKSEILSHYSSLVSTTSEATLYDKDHNEVGKIGKDEVVSLAEEHIDEFTEYFKISSLSDTYYIKYQDVKPTKESIVTEERYKNYIPFNESIITNENVNFYDKSDKLVYNIKTSVTLPILIKYSDSLYGVEYNNRLLRIKKEDIKEIKNNTNSNKTPTKSIAVLNYHFFYDASDWKEVQDCNQEICTSTKLLKTHLDYIKNNNIFTPTMEEYEMFLDKKINLPKSVLITIDDGWRMDQGIEMMEEYKINATVFLITSYYKDKIKFLHNYNYIEFHSHGDDLHTQGKCPGGQGGGIKCLDKAKLIADLKLSSQKLEGSKIFCYPFYEYNNYSIEVLKEAGYTMAFAGGNIRSGEYSNRYALPRYVMVNTTTADDLKSFIG